MAVDMCITNGLYPLTLFPPGSHIPGMASGNSALGKTVQSVAPSPADERFVRVHFGWARRWASRLARLHVWGWFNIPVGYEDETGFHFGVKVEPRNQK